MVDMIYIYIMILLPIIGGRFLWELLCFPVFLLFLDFCFPASLLFALLLFPASAFMLLCFSASLLVAFLLFFLSLLLCFFAFYSASPLFSAFFWGGFSTLNRHQDA